MERVLMEGKRRYIFTFKVGNTVAICIVLLSPEKKSCSELAGL